MTWTFKMIRDYFQFWTPRILYWSIAIIDLFKIAIYDLFRN